MSTTACAWPLTDPCHDRSGAGPGAAGLAVAWFETLGLCLVIALSFRWTGTIPVPLDDRKMADWAAEHQSDRTAPLIGISDQSG